jgi:uncharacterized membrane protein YsdA (DUF1294 family)
MLHSIYHQTAIHQRSTLVTRNAVARQRTSPYLVFSLVAVAIVLIIAIPLIWFLNLGWLWAYLLGINVATIVLYWYDKSVAGGTTTRVPERVLHGAELFGGTPAGFVGQRLFHHKNRKGSYQLQFWLIVLVQVIVVFLLWYFRLT